MGLQAGLRQKLTKCKFEKQKVWGFYYFLEKSDKVKPKQTPNIFKPDLQCKKFGVCTICKKI